MKITSTSVATDSPLLTPAETAAMLRVRIRTLEDWRLRRCGGPSLPYVKLGKSVRYRRVDVERVIDEGLVQHEAA
jgi:hypothetical protein